MGFLKHITPVVLTRDEEPNIGRCLERLGWAKSVVVVDSFSGDETEREVRRHGNATFIERSFDTHANQWNAGIAKVTTEWVLALDADYMVSPELIDEIDRLAPGDDVAGYRVAFRYACMGKVLRATLYPPKVVLFRLDRGLYRQDGHTQRLVLDGREISLDGTIVHDDRKKTDRWLANQWRYATLEAEKIVSGKASGSALDRLRRFGPLSPLIVTVYLYFVRGLILDGRPGLRYVLERAIAECLILVALGEVRMVREGGR